jgi:hypothetical protein
MIVFSYFAGETLTLLFSVQAQKTNMWSDTLRLTTQAKDKSFYMAYSNTLDEAGNTILNLDPMDTLVFVFNKPIDHIAGQLKVDSIMTPDQFSLSHFVIQNDTLLYIPQTPMLPNTMYSTWLQLVSKEDTPQSKVVQLKWQTNNGFYIESTNLWHTNQPQKIQSISDSIVIHFSAPIDTSDIAIVPFFMQMYDHQQKQIHVQTHFKNNMRTLVIQNTQPLALNNCGAWSTTTLPQAAITKILISASTTTGKSAVNPIAPHELKAYTEEGLCAVYSNTVEPNELTSFYLDSSMEATQLLHRDSAIRIGFNRPLDTTMIRSQSDYPFAEIVRGSDGDTVLTKLDFNATAQELILQPHASLDLGEKYYVRLQNIPALNIRAAQAIQIHGGLFSGSTSKKYLTTQSFSVR